VHGLHGVRYEGKIGDWEKESTKLADLIKAKPSLAQISAIVDNIITFRSYVS